MTLSLYARGMMVREIESQLEEMYSTEVSPTLISSVIVGVIEEVKTWKARPLDALCPIVYLDRLHVKVIPERLGPAETVRPGAALHQPEMEHVNSGMEGSADQHCYAV